MRRRRGGPRRPLLYWKCNMVIYACPAINSSKMAKLSCCAIATWSPPRKPLTTQTIGCGNVIKVTLHSGLGMGKA